MQKIRNVEFELDTISENDIFICAIGYEERSRYLLNKLKNLVSHDKILMLYFDDLRETKEIMTYIEEKRIYGIKTINVKYEQAFVLADETKTSMGSYRV